MSINCANEWYNAFKCFVQMFCSNSWQCFTICEHWSVTLTKGWCLKFRVSSWYHGSMPSFKSLFAFKGIMKLMKQLFCVSEVTVLLLAVVISCTYTKASICNIKISNKQNTITCQLWNRYRQISACLFFTRSPQAALQILLVLIDCWIPGSMIAWSF